MLTVRVTLGVGGLCDPVTFGFAGQAQGRPHLSHAARRAVLCALPRSAISRTATQTP